MGNVGLEQLLIKPTTAMAQLTTASEEWAWPPPISCTNSTTMETKVGAILCCAPVTAVIELNIPHICVFL